MLIANPSPADAGEGGSSSDLLATAPDPDTGLLCLAMLARFHSVAVDADQLAHDFGESGRLSHIRILNVDGPIKQKRSA